MKSRFRIFANAVQLHKLSDIAWRTCVNNCGLDDWERNLDWEQIDPDADLECFETMLHN